MLHPQFITFTVNPTEHQKIQPGFYRLHQFPKVIGAIDCSHIRIQHLNMISASSSVTVKDISLTVKGISL